MKRGAVARIVGVSLLAFCLVLILAGTAVAAGGPRAVTVDAGKMIGQIRSLQGCHWDPGPAGGPLSELYLTLGIDAIRTHDAGGIGSDGVGDIDGYDAVDSIFPDFTKDPADPASYNFGPTDQLIKNIRDLGARVFFRVGRSNRAGLNIFTGIWDNSYVPDIDKFAEVVRHVVMHYNRGWADGYFYGIRYWEIWNEPDFKPFWRGTPEQYFELYKKCALAIRSVDARAKIGGPANTTHNDYTGLEESLLEFIRANRLPMDFYSYHLYANNSVNPLDNARFAQKYRDLLDAYGFKHAEVVNSEYGTALDGTVVIGGEAGYAAFTAEAQMYMQDSPVDQVYAYMMVEEEPTLENKAFAMVSSLNRTPQRLWTSGGDETGFAVMAGRDEGRRELRVLIANYEISPDYMGPLESLDEVLGFYPIPDIFPDLFVYLGTMTSLQRWLPAGFEYQDTAGYNLTIKNIPLGWGDLAIEQYRIDNASDMELINTWAISKADRKKTDVTVSGAPWVQTEPGYVSSPFGGTAWDPGVGQGIDLIVVKGSTGAE